MKTLDAIKQEYARENNFCEWSDILYRTDDPAEIDEHFDKVAKLYALEACKETQSRCTGNFKLHVVDIDRYGDENVVSDYDSQGYPYENGSSFITLDKQSILSETNIPKELL